MLLCSTLLLPGVLTKKMDFRINDYLGRIGLDTTTNRPTDLNTLTSIMAAHSRTIPFENIDVVLGKNISMRDDDVATKLVNNKRGGYCFEQNTLLRLALVSLGYKVRPLLCRVRWGKTDDQISAFTHVALAVSFPDIAVNTEYLVDVGFAGTNSVAPVLLKQTPEGQPQTLPEGQFRVVPISSHDGNGNYTGLQMYNRKKWKSLYIFRTNETAVEPDLTASNWLSCTYPSARFTNQFFASIVVSDVERHHILNDTYVIRNLLKDEDKSSTAVTMKITNVEQLIELLDTVFGLDFTDSGSGEYKNLGRYLTSECE